MGTLPSPPAKDDPRETRDQTEKRVAQLEQRLEEEKMARNHLQLEKDRILEFWDITKARLAETQAKLRDVTLALERQQFDFMIQLKMHREERRALIERHHAIETEVKVRAAEEAKRCVEECQRQLMAKDNRHREALHQARMEAVEAENKANACRMQCEQQVAEARAQFEKEVKDSRENDLERLRDAIHAAEQRCLETIRATTAQRDLALTEMKDQQERSLEEISQSHASTVSAQLQLIASLKDEIHAWGYAGRPTRRVETHRIDT